MSLFRNSLNLTKVDLSFNVLECLPVNTFELNTHLQELYLPNNMFSQIHFKISHLHQLVVLDLQSNDINTLDADLRAALDSISK